MRTPERKGKEELIKLPYNEVSVLASDVDWLASKIFREFSGNIGVADALARLSFVAQKNFDPTIVDAYLSKDQRDTLRIKRYSVEPLPEVARDRLLASTAMAASMIVPEIDGDEVAGGYLQEPFPENPMLDRLYRNEFPWLQAKPGA